MNAFLVNTNSKKENVNPNGFKILLRQNKISAYDAAMPQVENISNGDLILLYHNENRIIAVGFAVNTEQHDYEDVKALERFVHVNWIWKANFGSDFQPLNSIDRKAIGGLPNYLRTVNNNNEHIDYRKLFEEIGKRQNFI